MELLGFLLGNWWLPIWDGGRALYWNPLLWSGLVLGALMALPWLGKVSGGDFFAPVRKRTLVLLVSLPLPLAAVGFFGAGFLGIGGNLGPLFIPIILAAAALFLAPLGALLLAAAPAWREKRRAVKGIYLGLLLVLVVPSVPKVVQISGSLATTSSSQIPDWIRLAWAPPLSAAERQELIAARMDLRLGVENERLPPAYTASLVENLKFLPLFKEVGPLAAMASPPQLIATVDGTYWGDAEGAAFLLRLASNPARSVRVAVSYRLGGLVTGRQDRQQFLERLAFETLQAVRSLQGGPAASGPLLVERGALAAGGGGTFNPRFALVNERQIVVAASTYRSSRYQMVAAAFDQRGRPDPGFGQAGSDLLWSRAQDPVMGQKVAVVAATAQGGAAALVLGELGGGDGGGMAMVLARLTGRGIDRDFGVDGGIPLAIRSYDDRPASVAVQKDGRILLGAASARDAAVGDLGRYHVGLLRLLANGTGYDPTFGKEGVSLSITSFKHRRGGLAGPLRILPDGKVLMVSQTLVDRGFRDTQPVLLRYLQDGGRDPSFGKDGLLPLDLGPQLLVDSLVRQSDGRLLLSGVSDRFRMRVLVRLGVDGALDPGFGREGRVVLPYAKATGVMAVQADDKILLLDEAPAGKGHERGIRLWRKNPDGSPDPSFGAGGAVELGVADQSFLPGDLKLLPDGQILVAGLRTATEYRWPAWSDASDIVVVRLTAEGRLDPGFGQPLPSPAKRPMAEKPQAAAAKLDIPFSDLNDAVWGEGRFVAVGRQGLILGSVDGRSWNVLRQGQGNEYLSAVVWGKGRYVAFARGGPVLTSTDALTWEPQTVPDLRGQRVLRAVWADGQFVAVGTGGLILTSPDGLRWQSQASGTGSDLVAVAQGADRLLALGKYGVVLTSVDGRDWRAAMPVADGYFFSGLAWSGREFVAVGDAGYAGVAYRSQEGASWERQEFRGFDRLLSDVVWTGTSFVAVGSDLALSPDGRSWSFLNARNPGTGYQPTLGRVLGGNGQVLALGLRAEVLLASDPKHWVGASAVRITGNPTVIAMAAVPVAPVGAMEQGLAEKSNERYYRGFMVLIGLGVGLIPYLLLQFAALVRLRGGWRLWARLPVAAVALGVALTLAGVVWNSDLLVKVGPGVMSVALPYLIVLLLAHFLASRRRGAPPPAENQ